MLIQLGNGAIEGPVVAKTLGTGVSIAATVPLWKRGSLFGHAFTRHGAGAKLLKSLIDKARDKGPQGQWLDNEAAALRAADWARVIFRNGAIFTAFPILTR